MPAIRRPRTCVWDVEETGNHWIQEVGEPIWRGSCMICGIACSEALLSLRKAEKGIGAGFLEDAATSIPLRHGRAALLMLCGAFSVSTGTDANSQSRRRDVGSSC
uniref:Uncharacterized protein n=1 Tax=Oryza nivara TaxID=4536 RepID=A0A0E0GCR8_ORYNI